MKIFEYRDYKKFLIEWIKEQPKGGRGQLKKMADGLRVSTTLMSQIISGDKHLSMELAAEVCDYLGMQEKEAEYFILLVEYQRAGAFKLQKIFKNKIEREQKIAAQLQNRIKANKELTSEEKMEFYSSWMYSGIRILSAIPEYSDVESISKKLKLPTNIVAKIVSFLLDHGLCKKENNQITYGPQKTHVGASSPFVNKHHQNWRHQGIYTMDFGRESDLFYTSPMAISQEVAEQIRIMLPSFIEQVMGLANPSESETVRCLNIDWFEY